ncbi:TetR/AcrR family transcriptional regulator [Reyranella aquatilis]|jgi:TetR/AcrR family transcriptional repressor of nem operon|uniref:TetR family transcriptional regulator n=1 Tax=Reyranella aquatilis TaxID=2035356 RepID=A0ABS8KPA9_9HYPH|nr:TetR/AcrR family transcriptional regulator [Reyranella aquatilis]MCC8427602.1 TetR family transcriptional regulator [Reyranella aquatilis]
MPISATRKAAIRAEIVEHAARLFRLRGHAGTNIDDIMLAAGLTRGAFYAHFTSKDDLFAEIVRMGHGLLPRLRAAGKVDAVLDDYLDREALAATAQGCALASLSGDVARSPLAARLAFANVLHGVIAELARGRKRSLDADATAVAILAVGAVTLARASGDTRLSDWLLRCARRTARALMKPKPRSKKKAAKRRASPRKKRSTSRPKAAAARPSRRASRSRGGRA